MKSFNEFLNENLKINILKESFIYHFTSLSSMVQILENKSFMSNYETSGLDAYKYRFISFTTDFNFYKKAIAGFKTLKKACAFEFDAKKMIKDKLNIDYYEYKSIRDKDYSNEKEVRYIGENLDPYKYLIKIYIFKRNIKKDNEYFLNKLLEILK